MHFQAPAPHVKTFRVPLMVLTTASLMGTLSYITWAPEPSSPYYSTLFHPGHAARLALPSWAVAASWMFLLPTHALEAIYVFTLCRKFTTPFFVGVRRWFIVTFCTCSPSHITTVGIHSWYIGFWIPVPSRVAPSSATCTHRKHHERAMID